MELLFFILLLTAVALGFVIGRWSIAARLFGLAPSARAVPQRYFESLNQLLHEQHDVALETFVTSLEVNSDTLETHLALGSLLRKRGEVDRAIRIHQNLLSRPSLNNSEIEQAQLELALDYKTSGLLDRAEALFKELQASQNLDLRAIALGNLVEIYQDEQEWQNAIECAERLCGRRVKSDCRYWRHMQANYSCELAEAARRQDALQEYLEWTKKALDYEKGNPRAAVNMAWWCLHHDDVDGALKWLTPLASRPELLHDLLPLARQRMKKRSDREYYDFLRSVFQKTPSSSLYLPIADELCELEGELAAVRFLEQELGQEQSSSLVARCLSLLKHADLAYSQVRGLAAESLPPLFTCRQCGFEAARVYWCCPTCKSWL